MKTELPLTEKLRVHFPDMSKAQAKHTAEFLTKMQKLTPERREQVSRFIGRLADGDSVARNLAQDFNSGQITAEELMQREAQTWHSR